MELTKCKLGELITQRREKNDGSNLPICGVSKDGLIPPKQIDADTSIYNVFYRDDFIFNPARMELNSIAINDKYDRAICSSLYEVFFVHRTDLLLPHFLKLIVKQKWFTRYCEFLGQGSAREYCRFNNISEIEIEFPPIEEQQRIVDYYSSIQKRIALKKQINDNLEAQALALFSDFVSQHNEKWAQGKLGDVISSANTGGDAIQKVPIVDYDTGIKCARVGDITNAREFASWAFCSATNSVFDNYKLQAGDILVTRTATLGITQYIPSDISAVYNNGLIRLKTDNNRALPLYVYWAINTSDFMNYINQMNSATSVRPNMKIDYLLNYQLLIPPIEKQIQFVKAVEVLMNAISLNNTERLKLCDFQSTLLNTLSRR